MSGGDAWTVRRVMDWTRGHFEQHQIDSARLTADLLLAHVLKAARVKLYMDFDRPLSKDELSTYKALIQRRLAGEPTQYLVGAKEFYGRRFSVDARVLIPRPETELLVEAALRELPSDRPIRVLDLCTGSGCIALTLAAERPRSSVWATDLSAGALVVARQNAEQLGLDGRVTFFEGDLCDPLPQQARFDLIVANPPYVRRGELATLQREVRREPTLALDGGDDGLEVLRRVLAQAAPRLNAGGLLALEIGEEQGAAVRELLVRAGYHDARIERDLERHDRLAFGRAPRPAPAQE